MSDATQVIGPARSTAEVNKIAGAAARHLAGGGLLVHPTSGVYGIGGAAESEIDAALTRMKGRAPGRPLICLVSGVDVVRAEFPAAAWSPLAARFAAAFWPGPLTLVLDDGTPHGRSVRCEAHPVTRGVLAVWGRALTSTSMNRSGMAPVYSAQEVLRVVRELDTGDRPILVIDAGDLPGPPPSTLVRVTREGWELLREGAIAAEKLELVAGR